jgi:uncharacterized damage-inducible protein DinB
MHARELLIDTFPHIPPARALEALDAENALRKLPNIPHSVAEIVAHLNFWLEWFVARCEGRATPMVASASAGWPTAGSWPELRTRFLAGLERLVGVAEAETTINRPLTPPIEFPPLAHYTVGDALVHVANHNAHLLGQVIVLRQIMGKWPPPSGGWTW